MAGPVITRVGVSEFLSSGSGVRELSLECGTLTAAMVDPEAILVRK